MVILPLTNLIDSPRSEKSVDSARSHKSHKSKHSDNHEKSRANIKVEFTQKAVSPEVINKDELFDV